MAPFTSKAVIMHETTQASFVSESSTSPFFNSFLVQGQKKMKDLRLASFGANDTSSVFAANLFKEYVKISFL